MAPRVKDNNGQPKRRQSAGSTGTLPSQGAARSSANQRRSTITSTGRSRSIHSGLKSFLARSHKTQAATEEQEDSDNDVDEECEVEEQDDKIEDVPDGYEKATGDNEDGKFKELIESECSLLFSSTFIQYT